jgi:hypothetical protein
MTIRALAGALDAAELAAYAAERRAEGTATHPVPAWYYDVPAVRAAEARLSKASTRYINAARQSYLAALDLPRAYSFTAASVIELHAARASARAHWRLLIECGNRLSTERERIDAEFAAATAEELFFVEFMGWLGRGCQDSSNKLKRRMRHQRAQNFVDSKVLRMLWTAYHEAERAHAPFAKSILRTSTCKSLEEAQREWREASSGVEARFERQAAARQRERDAGIVRHFPPHRKQVRHL